MNIAAIYIHFENSNGSPDFFRPQSPEFASSRGKNGANPEPYNLHSRFYRIRTIRIANKNRVQRRVCGERPSGDQLAPRAIRYPSLRGEPPKTGIVN